VTPVSTYLAAILCRHIYPQGNHVVIQCVGVHPGLSGKNSSVVFKMRERERGGERERSLLDKLRGVPTCQRCRRWPSDGTAALFFSVFACVSMLYKYYTSLPPLPSVPDPTCSPPSDSPALNTLCIPSILAVMHRRMILSCLPFPMPSVMRLHLQLCSTIVPCIPMMKFSCFTWYPE
jgi:hypothetical protein